MMIVILTWPLTYIKEHFPAICAGEYAIFRHCPVCQEQDRSGTIMGHGRRKRSCHSASTTGIVVRRGRCCNCDTTFTFLPCFVRPFHQYAVSVQADALERYVGSAELGLEVAAPVVEDADRYPCGSTVRRWFASMGEESLWRQVQALCGRGAGSGDNEEEEVAPGAPPRSKPRGALALLLHIWRWVQGWLKGGESPRVGSVQLGDGRAFLFLLLLGYPERGWVVT